jgi:hypothetical protein
MSPRTGPCVTVLTTERGKGAIDRFLTHLALFEAPSVRETTYSRVLEQGSVLGGAVVFGDFSRMTQAERAIARVLWDELSRHSGRFRLLNDPHRQLCRFDLLRSLWERGLNRFNVFRADGPLDGIRFPVFLRVENDHDGPRTELLHDRRELEEAMTRQLLAGRRSRDLLVTEYLDTRGKDGLYRKYGAFRFGGQVHAQHMFASRHWSAKRGTLETSEALDAEWNRYMDENPHQDVLLEVFKIVQVDYGRIDYSVRDGAVQVWEVNDNPSYLSLRPRNRPGADERRMRIYGLLSEMADGIPGERIAIDVKAESLLNALRCPELAMEAAS